jgi:hypothetical protein
MDVLEECTASIFRVELCLLLGLCFYPEGGSAMFLRNGGLPKLTGHTTEKTLVILARVLRISVPIFSVLKEGRTGFSQ